MKRYLSALALALVALAPLPAAASPIYAAGGECPSDAQMTGSPYTRQYYVTPALACVFDPDPSTTIPGATDNIVGTTAEANYYLGALGGWTGLGTNPANFLFTVDGGNDDGTFSIVNPIYTQYAVGIKDGGLPKWAIFLLPTGITSGLWGFSSSGGDLSHFTLYGRTPLTPGQQCTVLPCVPGDDPPTSVPDGGATLAMLGFAMGGLGYLRSRRS